MERMTFVGRKVYVKLPGLLFDTISIPIAWFLAFWLRYNLEPIPKNIVSYHTMTALGILACIQLACYHHPDFGKLILIKTSKSLISKGLSRFFHRAPDATNREDIGIFYAT